MSFPFHYSALNSALARSSENDSINIHWNQLQEKIKADSIMYMTPNFTPSISLEFPQFGQWGNLLLDPNLAIQQTIASFNNGSWMGGSNGFGGFNFGNFGGIGNGFNFGNMFGGNWGNWGNWGNNSNNSSTGSSELDALKALITKYKEIGEKNCSITPSLKDKITNTLNKSGSTEEKLTALKDLYKFLNKPRLEQAMLQLTEYKEMLTEAGYDFKSSNREKDAELKKELNTLEQDIKGEGKQLTLLTGGENDPSILRKISYWNDTHKDANNRSILRLIAENIPSDSSKQTQYKIGVKNLSMSLINKVEDFKASTSGEFTKLDKAKNEVSEALSKAQKDFTKNNITDLAKKFETLYAMLRILEAEKTRNAIKTKFSFLNNIASDDTDFVTDNLIVAETKADLNKEGISFNESDIDEIKQDAVEDYTDIDDKCDTPEEKVKALMADDTKALAKTSKDGVYRSTASNTIEPLKYYVIKDDKLVELKGVKSVDRNGICTKVDGKKVSLEQAKKDAVEVTAQDIINYKNTVDMVNKLVVNGTLMKPTFKGLPAGVTVYKSKGIPLGNKYRQYFVVKDGQLKQIDCQYCDINDGKFVMNDGKKLSFNQLTNDNFTTVGESDIVTEDENKTNTNGTTPTGGTPDPDNSKNDANYKEHIAKNKDRAEKDGKEIKDKLANWYTDDDDWRDASKAIRRIDKENVYTVISSYQSTSRWGADEIVCQIATEDGRSNSDKKALIIHIRDAVIAYAKEYGAADSESLKELEKFGMAQIFTGTDTRDKNKAKYLDKLILEVLGL